MFLYFHYRRNLLVRVQVDRRVEDQLGCQARGQLSTPTVSRLYKTTDPSETGRRTPSSRRGRTFQSLEKAFQE